MTSRLSSRYVGILSLIGLSAFGVAGCSNDAPADVPLIQPQEAPEPQIVPENREVDAVVVKEGPGGDFSSVERLTIVDETAASKAPAAPAANPIPAVVIEAAPVEMRRVSVDPVKAAAGSAGRLSSVGLAERFGADHARLIVQVNRAVNRSAVAVDRSELLREMQSAIRSRNVTLSSAYAGRLRVDRSKAIHAAFAEESRFLGIIPDERVSKAPEVIVNTVVEDDPDVGGRIVVSALDTRTGNVFWSESLPLSVMSEVPVQPAGE